MKKEFSKYFLAIIPPEPVLSKVHEIKEHFRDRYDCKAPMRSAPHITLHMPFNWRPDREDKLLNKLVHASSEQMPFTIKLDGFGAFPPRVIYVNLEESEPLMKFQRRLEQFAKEELNLFNANRYDHPYNPHITVAFRDLKKERFDEAWKEFQDRELSDSFTVDCFWLLKHDGKQWQQHRQFSFSE